ncbi:hypothetical protein H311_04081, partial [Anncaliia algerae PRA109]
VKKHSHFSKSLYKTKKYLKRRELLLENNNLLKDRYFGTNINGRYECILCHTLHTTVESYVRHKNGKKHNEKINIQNKPIKVLKHCGKKIMRNKIEGFVIEVNINDFTYPKYSFEEKNGTFIHFHFKDYKPFTYFVNYFINEKSLSDFYDKKSRKYYFYCCKEII